MTDFTSRDVDLVADAIRALHALPETHQTVAGLQMLTTKIAHEIDVAGAEHDFSYWHAKASTALGAASWSPDLEDMIPDGIAAGREAFAHANTDEQVVLALGVIRTAVDMRTMMRAKHLARRSSQDR